MRALLNEIAGLSAIGHYGRVHSVQGLPVEVAGPVHAMSIGSRVTVAGRDDQPIDREVVGFRDRLAQCMPFGVLDGVRMGCPAVVSRTMPAVRPSPAWLDRVINSRGEPIDGKGPLAPGPGSRPLRNSPPPAHRRSRVGGPIDLGVRALNGFVTCCKGQRMGIFAGSDPVIDEAMHHYPPPEAFLSQRIRRFDFSWRRVRATGTDLDGESRQFQ